MKKLNVNWSLLLRIVGIGVLVVVVYMMGKRAGSSELTGQSAPGFVLNASRSEREPEERIDLNALKGRAVALEFWAPWCSACRSTFGMVGDTELLFSDQDVLFLGVNVESSSVGQPRPANLSIASGIDIDGSIATNYGVRILPTFVIINREGLISDVISGVPSQSELVESVKSAL